MTISNDTLLYDIETQTFGKPDPTKDKTKIFGCFSYKTGKPYMLKTREDIQRMINAHKVLVGFNNLNYDNVILEREGIKLKYKIIVDLRSIFLKRAGIMKIKEGMLGDLLMMYSLDFITKTLGIVNKEEGKKEIDYNVFRKENWTPEETKEILEYTKRDIEVTKKLYEWVENYFEVFKPFLNEDDIRKKKYLTTDPAGFAYKALCHAMGWKEEYAKDVKSISIAGGYVAYPAGEKFEGDIYCLDFNSLYAHIMIQCNLYGRVKHDMGLIEEDRKKWGGDNIWKVNGTYYADELSKVCKLLKKWYADRLVYQKNKDRREYGYKIILNIIYGILNNARYVHTYDSISGGDCTGIGRQWIKYSRKKFREAGYIVIYSDTDSDYLLDPFKDKERMLKVKDKIINDIKKSVPFPQDTFDMGIDDEIKFMFFFKGGSKEDRDSDKEMDKDDFINKPKGFMKKNYIYVTKDNKVVIKNLGIRKKSNSPLSRKIFWEYLVPKIKEGQIKFSKTFIKNLITKLLEEDFTLITLRKDVGDYKQYESTSPNGLPAQISKKYGIGIHFLIPNLKKIGVGKGKSYCTVEEFKENKLKIEDIDLTNVWKELDYFIKPAVTKNIFDF